MTISTKLLSLAGLLAVPAALIACNAPPATSDDPGASSEEDAISASSRSFVLLRHDPRKCAAPQCGGWFTHDVNKKNPTEHYVSSIDFSNANLDDDAQDQVTGAADNEILVRAKLGPVQSNGTRALLVYEAYRGMPGLTGADTDFFYSVSPRDPQIQCFAAPCNNLTTKKLNTTTTADLTRTDIALGGRIDNAWLTERAEAEDAIVLGHQHTGAQFPGGKEKVLTAANVFLKLPETQNCPQFKLAACPSGTVRSYSRDTDRCVLPGECVPTHACPLFVPHCDNFYQLESWQNDSGCFSYVCDPSWVYPEQN